MRIGATLWADFRSGGKATSSPSPNNLTETAILDYKSPEVGSVVEGGAQRTGDAREQLTTIHRRLLEILRPVYSVNELQPASTTLRKRQGSCSQAMACLEAASRRVGIGTRVRALWIDGRFWYPRFRWSRPFIPHQILLVWPQFFLDGTWVDLDELYAPIQQLANEAGGGFKNDGETLFAAVSHTPVDLLGKTCEAGCTSQFDLSKFVLRDEGFNDMRDEVFEHFGSFQSSVRGRIFEAIYGGRPSRKG